MKKTIAIILSIMLVLAISLPAAAISTIAVKSIKLNNTEITLKIGQTSNLKATFTPANTSQKKLTYVTGNKKVATVDTAGKITGVSAGTTTITVYTPNRKISAKCNVTISQGKPVTLKYFNQIGWPRAGGVQDDPVAKEMQKQTGVTLDIIPQPTKDKLNVLLASGDLPDILECDTRIYEKQMVEGKQVIDLEALVQSNGQNILKNAGSMIGYVKEFESNGTGKLYHVDGMVDPIGDYNGVFAPFIRWDYYKELGYPKINSMDDLIDVVNQIVKKHPTTEDGKKVYGFVNWADWGAWTFQVFAQVLDRNIGGTAFQGFMQNMTNSTASCVWNDPKGQYWMAAKYMYKMRNLGLLDPETLTMKYETAVAKAQNNQVVCWFESWLVGGNNASFKGAGHPEKGYMPLPPVKGVGGYFGQTTPYGVPDRALYISSTCKTPDRAMDFLNYCFSVEGSRTMYSGINGKDYDNKTGVLNISLQTRAAMQNDKDFVNKSGVGKYVGTLSGLGAGYMTKDGQMINLAIDPKALSVSKIEAWPLLDDYAKHYGVKRLPNGVDLKGLCQKYAPGDVSMLVYYPIGVPALSDDIKRTSASIDTYIMTQLAKAVLADSDAEFDSIQKAAIEEANKMGAKEISNSVLPLIEKGLNASKKLIDKK